MTFEHEWPWSGAVVAAGMLLAAGASATQSVEEPMFRGKHGPLPEHIISLMKRHSWREGCPVPLAHLAFVELSHWGYDGKVHQGELVVHERVAPQVVAIFSDLFAARFPIEKIRLVDHYQGSDDQSMADNNTSAFNCRPVAGRTDVYSNHSFGLAIDINPLLNPYVTSKGKVYPPQGEPYKDRTLKVPGLVANGDACLKAFVARGWTWGGLWQRSKDYQHFEIKLDLNKAVKKIQSP